MSTPSPSLSPTDPLAFLQTITLHFSHISTTRVSQYTFDPTLSMVSVTFQLQSDKTRAYKSYSTSYVATSSQIAAGASAMVLAAYEQVWTLYHDDMLAFVAAQAVLPGSNQLFDVPIYT